MAVAVTGNRATPTQRTYNGLNGAYDFFNARLFDGELPECLITIQRRKGAYGYFAGERFSTADGRDKTDEIALNPSHFQERSTEEVLSTLVHEMTHLWQHHFGRPSRPGYHNKEWAAKMEEVGLVPSRTGAPEGKRTGEKMSHYVADDGLFQGACAELVSDGFYIPYVEFWTDEAKAMRLRKAASKTKYTCRHCNLNLWGKPGVKVICGVCQELLDPQTAEG